MKLLNISSVEYEKAEILSWFHGVVAPLLITVLTWILIDIKVGIESGITYISILTMLNIARLKISNKPFEHEKTYMFFRALKYLGIFVFFTVSFFIITMIGVYNA